MAPDLDLARLRIQSRKGAGRFAALFLCCNPIPTWYLATAFECAVHVTIFSDIPFDQSNKPVSADCIKPFDY
jgi:hypothetical protein